MNLPSSSLRALSEEHSVDHKAAGPKQVTGNNDICENAMVYLLWSLHIDGLRLLSGKTEFILFLYSHGISFTSWALFPCRLTEEQTIYNDG